MKFNNIKGHSAYVCFDGKYHGFKFELNKYAIRLLLGWVSFGIIKADVEKLIDTAAYMARIIKDNKERII